MDQHPNLAGVIYKSFKVITKETLFENTFPLIKSHTKLMQNYLYKTAKSKRTNVIKV
jgi:hypothetical protein